MLGRIWKHTAIWLILTAVSVLLIYRLNQNLTLFYLKTDRHYQGQLKEATFQFRSLVLQTLGRSGDLSPDSIPQAQLDKISGPLSGSITYSLLIRQNEKFLYLYRSGQSTVPSLWTDEEGLERKDLDLLQSGETLFRDTHADGFPARSCIAAVNSDWFLKTDLSYRLIDQEKRHYFIREILTTLFLLLLLIAVFILVIRLLPAAEPDPAAETDGNHAVIHLYPGREKLFKDIQESVTPVLIVLNIDSFREINGFFGYDEGDRVLHEIPERLELLIMSDEYRFYKLDADEFALLIDKELNSREVEVISRIIREMITETPFRLQEKEYYLSVTLGASLGSDFEKDDNFSQRMITTADTVLKMAKKDKKWFIAHDKNMNLMKQFEDNLTISRRIREAIREDRVVPFFQPILNHSTGQIEKYESLIRIFEDGQYLSPGVFMDVAKKTKHYNELTRIMIRKAFEVFKNRPEEVSVNISVNDIFDEETLIFITAMLEEHSQMCNRVVFEILESEGVANYDELLEFTRYIKGYGCKVAIDDFGSGFSNFEHILKLKIDYLKLDASLIKNLDTDENSRVLVKNISLFARDLGLKTIAEFVHNEAVFEQVKEFQVNYSQGYHIGKPEIISI